MPWTSHYVSDGVYTGFVGQTTGDEVLASVKEFFAHGYGGGAPRFALYDFTGCTAFEVEALHIQRIVFEDMRAAVTIKELAIAVVAPEAVQYGLSRMWQTQVEPAHWRTTIVTTIAGALRWLGDQGIDTDRLAVPQD